MPVQSHDVVLRGDTPTSVILGGVTITPLLEGSFRVACDLYQVGSRKRFIRSAVAQSKDEISSVIDEILGKG